MGLKLRVLAAVAFLTGVAAIWHFADLSTFHSAAEVGRAVRAIGEGRLGFVYVPAGFALGTLLFLPVTALIGGTILAFDPVRGFAYSLIGALLGAALQYGVGRVLGSAAIDRISSPRAKQFTGQLRGHPFRSSLILHVLPFGSFTVINLLAGSVRMPFAGFLAGCALGLMPGLVLFTFLAGRVPEAVRSPTPLNLLLLVAGAVILFGGGWWLRRWAKRREHGDLAT
ncbi:MAG: hypothetical protein H6Q89_1922 [Myxococcaceae bacterium]|nr:hypothetical protein [Myxococcaceae bacterium]